MAVAGICLFLVAACADESARPVLGPAVTGVGGTEVVDVSPVGAASPTKTRPVQPTVASDPLAGLVPPAGFEDAVLRVVNQGEETRWPVLYAGTLESRRQGLMGVTDLRGYTGMVFVFEADTEAAFWMRNTPMPLSIVFLGADGTVVSMADMEPCADVPSCPTYPPDGPYRFALEVPQGRLADLGVTQASFVGLE